MYLIVVYRIGDHITRRLRSVQEAGVCPIEFHLYVRYLCVLR